MSRILASIGFLIVIGLLFLVLSTGPEKSSASNALIVPSTTSAPMSSGDHLKTETLTDSGETQCISGCSAREAGFGWAESHEVNSEADCDHDGESHNSRDFVQGCQDYIRENRR